MIFFGLLIVSSVCYIIFTQRKCRLEETDMFEVNSTIIKNNYEVMIFQLIEDFYSPAAVERKRSR
jgi:hypothetical protein